MAYLQEFKERIDQKDFTKVMQLWEEYTNGDDVDPKEFLKVMRLIGESELASQFGKYVETALPLWSKIEDPEQAYQVLKEIFNLQTTNSSVLADLATQTLENRYKDHKHFKQKMRLIGLRTMSDFQGALANFELLSHMDVGKFVYHTGGWGTGEIVELSLIREHVIIEFENISGRRDMNFQNAFHNLIPLPNDHILSKRFGDPDALEKEAKKDPAKVIRQLLHDLGPKTAAEIKDELSEWVIPEKEWTKWWQSARAKLKKDKKIDTPKRIHEPFHLHEEERSHEERMQQALHQVKNVQEMILTTYNYTRDFPAILKDEETKQSLQTKMLELLEDDSISMGERLQVAIFLENQLAHKLEKNSVKELILGLDDVEKLVNSIGILAFQKRALVAIRKYRSDWVELFLSLLFSIGQNTLRDFILRELNHEETRPLLVEKMSHLLHNPIQYPDLFVWYFQKVATGKDVPFADSKEHQCDFMEAFLILYSQIEMKPAQRDLVKRMYNLLSKNRYELVRSLIEGSSFEFIKEFLLLVTKCRTLSDSDIKIMHSLAEVAHPQLGKGKKKDSEEDILWTTEEGYKKVQSRIEQIGSSEIVDCAKEIEEAKSHGDLRENSEYKAALERRSRLQSELRTLSEQFKKARIITPDDIPEGKIGVGSIATLENPAGERVEYTILGPWDANASENVISFESQLAKAMVGKAEGESFTFKDNEYHVKNLKSFFKKV